MSGFGVVLFGWVGLGLVWVGLVDFFGFGLMFVDLFWFGLDLVWFGLVWLVFMDLG